MARRWVVSVAAVTVGLVVWAAACSSDSSGSAGSVENDGRLAPVGDRVDTSGAGFHQLGPAPVADRNHSVGAQVVVWTGREVVIWGGRSGDDGSAPGKIVGDGATFDLDEGQWRPMSPSPFSPGLYNPMGAWDGHEVIIIGTECDLVIPPVTDGSPPECPDGPAAGAYDPATGSWRRLDPPPIPFDVDYGDAVLSPRAAVGGDGGALFAFDWSIQTIAWDRASESWQRLDSPLGDGPGLVCADTMQTQLVVLPYPQPGSDTPSAAQVLAVGDGSWSEPVSLGVPVDEGFTCSDDLVAVGDSVDFVQVGSSGLLIDVRTGTSEVAFPAAPAGEWRQPFLVGPWLFTTTASTDVDLGEVGDPFDQDHQVRLVDGDVWQGLDAPKGFVSGYRSALYLPGVGILSSSADDTGEPQLTLWRASDDLQP